jgi:predicted phosphoribosyltransferase
MTHLPRFPDRFEAGRELAHALAAERGATTVVVGLARGGVQVASEVAKSLAAPLDAVAVRKVGHPHQPEYALGAVAPGRISYVRAHDGLTDAELAGAVDTAHRAADELDALLHRHHPPEAIAGKTAVLVDDGLATGATMIAAARWARAAGARRVVAAAPVGATRTVALLRDEVDEVVCPRTTEAFGAVGFWYVRFDQVDDRQVTMLLEEAAGRYAGGQAA